MNEAFWVLFTCTKATSSFFLGLIGNTKECYNSYLDQGRKRLKWFVWAYNNWSWVIKHLHCLFVVIDESVKNWFKSEPFDLQRWVPVGTNESFKEWCTTGGGVEWLLKSLLIFLKQAITLPKDFLMFLITYFFPLKINSSAKTISISADIDFSSLRRYIFRHCNLFIWKKK